MPDGTLSLNNAIAESCTKFKKHNSNILR